MNTEILHKATKKRLVPQLRFPEFEDEWRGKKIGQLLKIGSGKDYKHLSHGKIPVFGTGGLMCYVNDFLFSGETVFIGRKGSIDKPFYFDGMFWTVDTLFYTYEFKNTIAQFIYALFQKIDWYKHNEASGVPSLSKRTIETIIVNIPSLPEQQKIASFLSAVDEKIQQLTRKKELLEQYKKGVMQQLFSGKLRFKDDKGNDFPEWEMKRLGEVSERVTRKNKENNLNVLTISAQLGLVSQLEYFNKSVSAKNVTNYYLLERNEFAYNKSYSNGYPMGAIKKLSKYDKGVVSTLYICFQFNNNVSLDFMEHYFEFGKQNNELEKVAQEGARNHGLLNIGVNDFFNIQLELPSIKEQQKIADFLSNIDVKIENVNQQLNQAQQFKKGLLQQLFV